MLSTCKCKKIIGILTFHRVYNYGAVIQAYSMQKIIESYGYECEIIDFSKRIQFDYTNIISFHNGSKRFLKTLILLPAVLGRMKRKRRFDEFINKSIKLSTNRYENEDQLRKSNDLYSAIVVGSDQIWNINKSSDFSAAYFLDFAADKCSKIAYAPSIGSVSYEKLLPYRELIKRFNSISCRETGGAAIISKIINYKVPVVLDPTLLVNTGIIKKTATTVIGQNDQTVSKYKSKQEKYLLYYSLDGFDKRKNNCELLKAIKKKYGLSIKFITPEWPFHNKNVGEDIIDAGPKEFLNLINNASLICTNSFHGTALALKFNKPLFVLEDKGVKDERKRSILEQVGADSRIISNISELDRFSDYSMDYSEINKRIDNLRKSSENYLLQALNNIKS